LHSCYVRARRRQAIVFTKTRLRAIAFTAFIALVWLNQSLGGKEWGDLREQTFADPKAHIVDLIRSPVMFLYRRASDEQLYFATASATLGLPYDTVSLQRGDSPLPPLTTPADGHFHVPYAEVPLEYPPPNVPFVIGPRLVVTRFATYAYVFGALMGSLLLGAAIMAARLGARRGDEPRDDEAHRIFAFGLLLLAHGAIAIQRLDAIVALLAVLMVRAAVRGDDRGLGFWGGLIGATKLVPILVLPAIVLASGMRGGKRLGTVALFAGLGLTLGLGPMVVLGRESLPLLLSYHSARGLHVESTLGVVYGAVKAVLGMREASTLDFGSFNFHGPVSQVLAKASTAVTLALVGFTTMAARSTNNSDDDSERTSRIVLAALATMTALWLGGKVFSPQYLTWALPLVVAVPGPTWRRIALWFGAILAVSQLFFRAYYDHVYNQAPLGVTTMVVRLALLIAFFLVLVRALRVKPATA
jgi:hypothetical protein